MVALIVSSTARVSPRGQLPHYHWDAFRYCKTRSHLRSVQIKFGKQGKSHFSRPSALETIIPCEPLGQWSHGRVITNPSYTQQDCQYFFGSSSRILSSIWPQWSGEQQFGSQTKVYLIETRQALAVAAISTSVALATAHNSIKAAARPASMHQRCSPAHIMSYPAESMFC